MVADLKIGDLVWAKMKGFSPWPARVVKPGPNTKKPTKKGMHWIYFFGTYNYAWIEEPNIKPYAEFKDKFVSLYNTVKFKEAVSDIEDFIIKKKDDPNYEIVEREVDISDDTSKIASSPSPKKPRKSTGIKRQSSDVKHSNSKKARHSSKSPSEENGVYSHVGNEILNLPSVLGSPESPSVDLNNLSDLLKTKNISASSLTFGFLGVGTIGSGIVKNLINSGHRVNLWNRSPRKDVPKLPMAKEITYMYMPNVWCKCEEIKIQADANNPGLVNTYDVPCDVVQNSDIIFSCVADPRTAKEIVHGNCGVVHLATDEHALEGKGYVEMTGIDPETSKDIYEIITSKGGRYLEAQIQGSKLEADEGSLVVLTAGDKSLFIDCQSCFKAMGKTAFFLGEVGYATKVNLILQLMKGVALVGLAEGFALADRCGISSKEVLKIFNLTNLACPYLSNKSELIVKKEFGHVEQAIQHMQKDMKLALDISDSLKQPLLMASTANEVYKHARRLGYDGHDASCIYMRTRH